MVEVVGEWETGISRTTTDEKIVISMMNMSHHLYVARDSAFGDGGWAAAARPNHSPPSTGPEWLDNSCRVRGAATGLERQP